jgi:hypothetical protein
MSKKKNKKSTIITSHKGDDLKGFEEVMDLVGLDPKKGPKNVKDSQIEDYEIYDFLEKENLRLEKIDRFFNTQIPLEQKYSQTKKLIKEEIGQVNMIKDELTIKMMSPQSDFYLFMEQLYQKAFN